MTTYISRFCDFKTINSLNILKTISVCSCERLRYIYITTNDFINDLDIFNLIDLLFFMVCNINYFNFKYYYIHYKYLN